MSAAAPPPTIHFRLATDSAEPRLDALVTAGCTRTPLGAEEWIDEYFDSPDGRCYRDGLRLVRHCEGDADCWRLADAEQPAPTDRPPTRGPVAAHLAAFSAGRRFLPVLRAAVRRRGWRLDGPSGFAAVAWEETWRFADPYRPEHEAELRLLAATPAESDPSAGDSRFLAALLRDLAGLAPMEFEPLAAGLAALREPPPGAPRPPELRLEPRDSFAAALRKILRLQAYKMRANTRGAELDLDPEFVHDLRVATRRARFALRVAEKAGAGESVAALRVELAWIADLLGEVRDLDVLLERLNVALPATAAPPAARRAIRAYFRARRDAARAALAPALASRRCQRLVGRLRRAGLGDGEFTAGAAPAVEAAPALIRRAARRLRRLQRDAPAPDAETLHALRIAGKRLRYTCEYFADLYDERLTGFIRAVVKIQNLLGEHQDAVVALVRLQEMADRVAPHGRNAKEILLAVGALQQFERDRQSQMRAAFAARQAALAKRLKRLRRYLVERAGAAPDAERPPAE